MTGARLATTCGETPVPAAATDEERRRWWEAKDFHSTSYPAQMYYYEGTGLLLPITKEVWATQTWPDRPHP